MIVIILIVTATREKFLIKIAISIFFFKQEVCLSSMEERKTYNLLLCILSFPVSVQKYSTTPELSYKQQKEYTAVTGESVCVLQPL